MDTLLDTLTASIEPILGSFLWHSALARPGTSSRRMENIGSYGLLTHIMSCACITILVETEQMNRDYCPVITKGNKTTRILYRCRRYYKGELSSVSRGVALRKASSESILESQLLEDVYRLHGIDRHDARIIGMTYESPRDMLTISTNLGIPISECYVRAKKLSSLGLLKKLKMSSPFVLGSRKKTLFYANRNMVEVVVIDGTPRVKVRRTRTPNGSVYQFSIIF